MSFIRYLKGEKKMFNEEQTLKYINGYNRYVKSCEDQGVPITVTYPMFKSYCEMVKGMM